MAYRYGENRKQITLFPQSLDQYVSEDHPVRAYDAFVDSLDFVELGIELDDRKVGNSQYDPRSMLKLLIYGYSYGVKSSRKLEREVHNNLSFIWLIRNLKPDHKTIAEFRRNNSEALKNALKLCARLCLKIGLIQGNILFVDGTKIRANASLGHHHEKQWYQEQLKKVDQRIHQLLAECERCDQDEETQGSLVKMPKELKNQQHLKASIKSALAEFDKYKERTKDGNLRQINRVDPESTRMISRKGYHPSYNVQSVVDDQNGLIVHVDVVNDANDQNQLSKQIIEAQENLECECTTVCADAGYTNIEDIYKLESDERSVIVPTPRQVSGKEPGPFDRSKFTYDDSDDCYYCPEGQRLIFRGFQDKEQKKRNYRIEKPMVCKKCQHFGKCTAAKSGRTIIRHALELLREKVIKRYLEPEAQKIYKRRKMRVEHPFGYIKKSQNFNQFQVRGLRGALTEASLLATSFNLIRMIGLLGGVKQFMAKIEPV